jgi:hypothetical protein
MERRPYIDKDHHVPTKHDQPLHSAVAFRSHLAPQPLAIPRAASTGHSHRLSPPRLDTTAGSASPLCGDTISSWRLSSPTREPARTVCMARVTSSPARSRVGRRTSYTLLRLCMSWEVVHGCELLQAAGGAHGLLPCAVCMVPYDAQLRAAGCVVAMRTSVLLDCCGRCDKRREWQPSSPLYVCVCAACKLLSPRINTHS